MAYAHVNEYYTGYFAEGSSDYAGQQGPGYTHMSVSPTTNTSKTVNIYFAEPVICTAASGKFYRTNSPSVSQNIDVSYRVLSSQTWTNIRPSEPIDAMVLKCYQFNQWSGGLSGFTWEFASLFTWGEIVEPDPEPEPEPVDPVDPDPSTLNTGYLPVPRQILLFRRRVMMLPKERQPVLITDLSSWFDSSDPRYKFWTGKRTAGYDTNFDGLWQTTLLKPLYFKSITFSVNRQLTCRFEVYDENGVQTYSRSGQVYNSSMTFTASTLVRAKTFKIYFTSGSQEYGTIAQSGYEMYG